MKLQYFAKAQDGSLKVTNRQSLVKDLKSLEGKDLVVTIERRKKKRSHPQNRYMWAVVIPIVKQGLIDAGWEREKVNNSEVVHELLKSMFCPKREVINHATGEVLELPATTTSLTTTQMMEYFEDIQRWGAEFLGIYIPEPNEQMELDMA